MGTDREVEKCTPEISTFQRYHVISLTCGISRTNKPNKSQKQTHKRRELVVVGWGGGGLGGRGEVTGRGDGRGVRWGGYMGGGVGKGWHGRRGGVGEG